MTEEVRTSSSNNAAQPALSLKPGSSESLEKQYAQALVEKYGDDIGKWNAAPPVPEPAKKRAPQIEQAPIQEATPSAADNEASEEDEFVAAFGKKSQATQQEHDEAPEEVVLPETLEDLAAQLKTTPERLLEQLKVRTKVKDEEAHLALKDIVKGYQTDKYIAKKSEAVAVREREIDSMRQAAEQRKQQLDQNLHIANGLLENQYQKLQKTHDSIDWNRLRQEDPTEYAIKKQEFAEERGRIDYEMRELGRIYWQYQDEIKVQETHTKEQQVQLKNQRMADERNKLLDSMPALREKEKAQLFQKEFVKSMESWGFDVNELNDERFADHRLYVIANKAMLYDRMMSGKMKEKISHVATRQPKSNAAPSSSEKAAENQRVQGAFEKLKSTRSLDDAVAFLSERGHKF